MFSLKREGDKTKSNTNYIDSVPTNVVGLPQILMCIAVSFES